MPASSPRRLPHIRSSRRPEAGRGSSQSPDSSPGIRHPASGIRRLASGIWHLASGIWHLASGDWRLATGIRHLATPSGPIPFFWSRSRPDLP